MNITSTIAIIGLQVIALLPASANDFITFKHGSNYVSIKTSSIIQIEVAGDMLRVTTSATSVSMRANELESQLKMCGSRLGFGDSKILYDLVRYKIRFLSLPADAHKEELAKRKRFLDGYEEDLKSALKLSKDTKKLDFNSRVALGVAYKFFVSLSFDGEIDVLDLESKVFGK